MLPAAPAPPAGRPTSDSAAGQSDADGGLLLGAIFVGEYKRLLRDGRRRTAPEMRPERRLTVEIWARASAPA